ncbi:ammonium transporter Rh type A-like [Haliotis rufescens]|uniref:ammonium transporter Rh type A-like n=1 Tax=Haliotis rufescens TaxID=6454 RepID=UPI001EB03EE1|nr:ammonium transporter Rh type A-like [Haliotis rufescens]
MSWQRAKLPTFVFVCQIAFILIFAFMAKYGPTSKPKDTDTSSSPVKNYYGNFQDVNVMIFVGFGFLMTFLKRYGYSSVGLNFLVAAFAIQWTTIIRGLLHIDITTGEKFKLYVQEMMSADFSAAGVLISFGALLGKISPLQLLVMTLIEVVLLQINEWICVEKFHVSDVGESMFVHVFGAYFGLAAARVLYSEEAVTSKKAGPVYHSDLFSMIGTLFLWMYWPSFNGGAAEGDEQHRAILNTYFSLAACCCVTFAMSAAVEKHGKFEMEHIQNATLAGGVAVGTCANMNIEPWGALVVGSVAGILSVVGYKYISPFIAAKLKIHDTCGVNNLHGMPGIMAGIGGAVTAALATENVYGESLYEIFPARSPLPEVGNSSTPYPVPELQGLGRTAGEQAAFQIYALLLSLGMAIAGGIVTGAILKMKVWDNPQPEHLYDDERFWELPEEGIPEIDMDDFPSKYNVKEIDTKM